MGSLQPYLPPLLLRSPGLRASRWPFVERIDAALLLSDIAGFTALTERLQARGRGGAEEVAAVVGAALRPAIDAADAEGGSIVGFGGDAVFALFPGAGAVARARRVAARAADAVERRGAARTSVGRVPLRITQAIHRGTVLGIHVGTAGSRHLVTTGPAVLRVARTLLGATSGTLSVTAAARARGVAATPARRPPSPVPAERLLPYLPAPLLPLLAGFEGEYRDAAILFMETRGWSAPRLQAFFVGLSGALDACGGTLLKSDLSPHGVKWLCVFGVPEAHEDDPDRAALAAVEVLRTAPAGLPLRGGLHAGTVACLPVGTPRRRCLDVMGDVVNTAARSLSLASWGEVLVTDGTRRRLARAGTVARGSHAVKGKSEPLEVHALSRAGTAAWRPRSVSPLVGREALLATLTLALEEARDGRGATVALRGEAGIGKSRLAREAGQVAARLGVDVLEGRAIAFGGTTYWAIAEILRRALDLAEGATGEAVLQAVRTEAARLALGDTDRHHLGEILGVREPASPLAHLDRRAIRLNNMAAFRSFARARARSRPLLLVVEDVQWADEPTREALAWVAGSNRGDALLLLLAARPEAELPPGARILDVPELPDEDVDRMLDGLLPGRTPQERQRVRERSQGNPLYVEEVARLWRQGGRTEDLPEGLGPLLAARLGQLPAEPRHVAQVGAVIGRSFREDVLTMVLGGDAWREPAAVLVAHGVIDHVHDASGAAPELMFRQALMRDAAYESLLVARRRGVHRRVARAIERSFRVDLGPYQAMLGHHWERAGDAPRARRAYLEGARRAAAGHAHEEAERLFTASLALHRRPSAEAVRAHLELASDVLRLRGRNEDARRHLEEGARLSGALRMPSLEARALRQLGNVLRVAGEVEGAMDAYGRALSLAGDDLPLRASIRDNVASALFARGRVKEAIADYEAILAEVRARGEPAEAAVLLTNLAVALRQHGDLDRAERLYEEVLALDRQRGDPVAEAIDLNNLAGLLLQRGRAEAAEDAFAQALERARRVGYRRIEAAILSNLGVLWTDRGRPEEARRSLMDAVAVQAEIGDRRAEVSGLCALAKVDLETGLVEDAAQACERALAIAVEVGDPRGEGVAARHRARVSRLALGDLGAARRDLRRAESLLRDVGDAVELVHCLCEAAFLSLAEGGTGHDEVRRAREAVEGLGLGAGSPVASLVDHVAAAASGASAGRFRGEPLAGISAPLRRWLEEHGHLPAGPPRVQSSPQGVP